MRHGYRHRQLSSMNPSSMNPRSLSIPTAPLAGVVAAELGRTPMQLFGSLKNLARRLLDAFRYMILNDQAFDSLRAASIQIRLDSS